MNPGIIDPGISRVKHLPETEHHFAPTFFLSIIYQQAKANGSMGIRSRYQIMFRRDKPSMDSKQYSHKQNHPAQMAQGRLHGE